MPRTLLLLAFITLFASNIMDAQISNEKGIEYNWKTDLSKSNTDLDEFMAVLPRGSFPKLDYPKFVGKDQGMEMFYAKEPVIVVEFNGDARAYSQNMLTMHEIVNDEVGGTPVLITYCPLCDASMVYDRRLEFEGQEYLLEFEVSGMLRMSDMVMIDTKTETWWQQLDGEGLVGEFSGGSLTYLASSILSVESFFNHYPNGKIMSKDNQEGMEYYNPYDHYDELSSKPYERFFDEEDIDGRLPAMERIVVVEGFETQMVYAYSLLEVSEVINDVIDEVPITVFYSHGVVSVLDEKDIKDAKDIGTAIVYSPVVDDNVLSFKKQGEYFVDEQTNSKWDITGECIDGSMKGSQLRVEIHGHHFAFAYLAFNPEANIYGQ